MKPSPLLCLFLFACSSEPELPPAALSILTPGTGDTVESGNVPVSIIVSNFELVGAVASRSPDSDRWILPSFLHPIPAAHAHDEDGAPSGLCVLRLNGDEVARIDTTQHVLEGVVAGSHELEAELVYEDGDALEPPVVATVTFEAVDPTE